MMDWKAINNPVLLYEDYSIKDACMAYRDGVWHLFFSAFDQERSAIAQVSTTDFKQYSDFKFHIDGQEQGWIGMCSPDLCYGDGKYVLVFNSWGGAHELFNRMFYMESEDLETWTAYKPLGHELDPEARIIDGALAWNEDHWICCCKWWKQPRMARAESLDGPWSWVSEEKVELLTVEGKENGLIHENFQLIQLDGTWHLLSTDYKPHHPWLYRMEGDPREASSWLKWVEGDQLKIPQESFNTRDLDNAAALAVMPSHSEYQYLIYAGQDERRADEFTGTAANGKAWARGWNQLGVARSRDLVDWHIPG